MNAQWIIQTLEAYQYPALVALLIAGGMGVPIPEDVPLLFIGYMAGSGKASLEVAIPLSLVCVLGGDFILFSLGRRLGTRAMKLPLLRGFLTERRILKAESMIERHGGKFLFAARFAPGLRAVCFFCAGMLKVPAWKFFLYDGMAAVLSVPLLIGVAWYLGQRYPFQKIAEEAHDVQRMIFGVAAAVVVIVVLVKLVLKKRAAAAEAAEEIAAKPPV
jgi:membrane protein DedA with SNARE-associated domain